MAELTAIIFISFILDLLIGDPVYKVHPVRIIGQCINYFDKNLRHFGWDGKGGGVILVMVVETIILAGYVILATLFEKLHPWLNLALNLFLCYSCIAFGDLLNHMKPVVQSLEDGDLQRTRKAMALVVGREVGVLDRQGLIRAALETMAENFVDGFVSPLFWYFIGGILSFIFSLPMVITAMCFMLTFKGASTLDSMVGYKNNRYLYFGWAGARLDDLMNFFPARISLLFLFIGSRISGLEAKNGLKIAFRDRLKHDSPNAAHAESFVAGALGLRLGGPTRYQEGMKNKPWLGEGTPELDIFHIYQTSILLKSSAWVAVLLLFSPLLLSFAFA